MKALDFIIILFLLIILAGASYFLYLNIPGKEVGLKIVNDNISDKNGFFNKRNENANYSESKQFYENMRFPDRVITYHVDEGCSESKKSRAVEAFSILEARTILTFIGENKRDVQIKVVCSNVSPEPDQEGHFVAGEGGPTRIINTSLYAVILEGKFSLYRDDKCDTSHIALHELLHVLGFDHNNDPGSILYPTLNCDQILDQYFIDEINRLYVVSAKPDLKIQNVNATKSGRYLNFNINIINQGLVDTDNVVLGIYADGDFVSEFDLDEINIGSIKTLNVQNARLPSRFIKEITFFVDRENIIDELIEDNNQIELVVEE